MRDRNRTYDPAAAAVFRSTRAKHGGLSNMAAGFPLVLLGQRIHTSEALYQTCRFPHIPEIQAAILRERSPMSAKMVSRSHTSQTRGDWERIKVKAMRWCIEVKLAQNFETFGRLIEATGNLDIVENSRRDAFW